MTILVTGSEGLIGRHLISSLTALGIETRPFDIARTPHQDVRDEDALRQATEGVSGVVVLAAVSRVIWAERDPDRCVATNIDALKNLLRCCLEARSRPWVLFASSREVYGEATEFPVPEDAPYRPVNLYARSKVCGEALVQDAARAGLNANICRLSSVYGCPFDHHDRVSMAFARAAALGGRMVLEGRDNLFDFTSIRDVTRGMAALVQATAAGERLPPIHFVSGTGTTLKQLAGIARKHARYDLTIEEAPPRSFDVAHFVGDPSRARELLGWKTEIAVTEGLPQLISDIANTAAVERAPAFPHTSSAIRAA